MKNLKKNDAGITLIALIVTIIVLIILAVVSVNAVFGENGLIARAELAKTETEMAGIKEEAEMVKASLQMDVYEGKLEELNKNTLVAGLKDHFVGSTLDGENVVVNNGKYAIVIGDDLSIDVIKNGESSGNTGGDDSGNNGSGEEEQTGTIEIAYIIEDLDENTKIIRLGYSGDIRKVGVEEYESLIEEIAGQTIPEEIKEEWKGIAQENGISYEEVLIEVIGVGDPLTSDVRAEAMGMAEEQGVTYRAFLEIMLEEQGIFLPTAITAEEYEAFIEELYGESIPEDTKEELKELAQNNGVSYKDILLEIIALGELLDSNMRTLLITSARENGRTYTMLLKSEIKKAGISLPSTVEVDAYLDNKILEIQNSQIVAKRNATYKIVATTKEGARGETEIELTGIIDEKFSEIYTASADYTDSLGNKARIPKGFAVGTSSDINSIDKGLVITDSVDENGYSNGNEYVWVPVSNINGDGSNKIKVRNADGTTKEVEITLGRYTFDETDGTPTIVQKGLDYANETKIEESSGSDQWYYQELKDFREAVEIDTGGKNETAKDLAGFISSVETNGGYYIARYEASYDSGSSIDDYKLASKVSTRTSGGLSKGKLWNNITQGDMAKVCKNMYTEEKYNYVEADLTNSYAWDTAIVFIQNCSDNSNYANANCVTTGNNDRLNNTGLTGDIECNVYDMAGNVAEWTTEYSSFTNIFGDGICVRRGGDYNHTYYNTSERDTSGSPYSYASVSGRPILYNSNPET